MKFTTNNISQTVVLDGFVLPQTLWYFGGKYQLISGENFVYVLVEKNKQNFDSINKKMGNSLPLHRSSCSIFLLYPFRQGFRRFHCKNGHAVYG